MTEPPPDAGVPSPPERSIDAVPTWKEPARLSPLALIALIVGIISLPSSICCWLMGLPVSLLGITLGAVSLVQFKNAPPGELKGKELAIIGLIASCLSLVMFLALIIFGIGGQLAKQRGF